MNKETPPLLTYLESKGISLQSLIDSALEMFVPHPGVETKEKATQMLVELICFGKNFAPPYIKELIYK